MDIKIIEDVQRLILNRISWKLFLETPKETSILILRELFEDEGVCPELEENVCDWINFSLNEWFLFKKYDQFLISVSSILLGLRVTGLEQQVEKLVDLVKNHGLGDLTTIQTCIQYMVAIMNQSEEEGENELLSLQSTGQSEDMHSLRDDDSDSDSDSTFCQSPCGVQRPIPTVKTLKKTKRTRLSLKKGRKQVFVVVSEKRNCKSMHKNRQAKISEFVKKEKPTQQQNKI